MDFFKKITIYAILLVTILVFQKPVLASEIKLNFSDFLNLEGLSFSTPLPAGLSVQSSTLEFHKSKTIKFEEESTNTEHVEPTITPALSSTLAPIKLGSTTKPKTTNTPIPTKTTTHTPIPTSAPTPTPTPTIKSVSSQQLSNGGLDADKLFSMSNNYRRSRGLTPFQKDDRSCSLAVSRAPEINEEIVNG